MAAKAAKAVANAKSLVYDINIILNNQLKAEMSNLNNVINVIKNKTKLNDTLIQLSNEKEMQTI